jgi:hypothetical protein
MTTILRLTGEYFCRMGDYSFQVTMGGQSVNYATTAGLRLINKATFSRRNKVNLIQSTSTEFF